MRSKRILLGAVLASLPVTAVVTTDVALAQSEARTLEEIVVTARKREENLQQVPEAVSAVGQEVIESSYAQNGRDLEGISPNLVFDRVQATPGGAALSIRGVSFQDVEKSFDPAVGVVIDGVYLGTNTSQFFQVFDLERIEVLRGPQGTLFGKNTIGGILSLTRTQPTGEWGGKLRLRSGTRDRFEFDGILNFPISQGSDVLAGKVTFSNRQQEGWYRNIATGGDRVGDLDYQSWSANFLYRPTEAFALEYTYQREEDDSDTAPLLNVSLPTDLQCFFFAQCGQGGDVPQTGDRFVVNQNGSDLAFIELDAHTLEAGWDLNNRWRLDYIFGLRESEERVDQDFDASPLPFFETVRTQDFEQTSHELRVTYDSDAFDLVAGYYRWDSEYTLRQLTAGLFWTLLGLPSGTFQQQNTDHETEADAFFAQADIMLGNAWILTLGGRYTSEEKTMARASGFQLPPEAGGIFMPDFSTFGAPPSEDWSEFSPKAGLSWIVNDDLFLFATYSSGFRSGGFNGRAITLESSLASYDPETVDNIELGIKSEWAGGRLRLNATAFRMEYDDKQEEIVQPTPGGDQETIVQNASKAVIQGVEVEFLTIPFDGFTLRGNIGFLDAEYDEFCADIDGAGMTPDAAPGQTVCGPVVGPVNGTFLVPTDNTNLELRRAPEITWALNAAYEWPLGGGTASVQAAYRYKDDYYTTFQNTPPIGLTDSHGQLDASINYDADNWRFSLFGRNLTDEVIENSALFVAGFFTFSTTSEDRQFGLEAVYEFGGGND